MTPKLQLRRAGWIALTLLTMGCSDPGYEVRGARLAGSKVTVDVQYGMGSQVPAGLILIDGQPLGPEKVEHTIRGKVEAATLTLNEKDYKIRYAKVDKEFCLPPVGAVLSSGRKLESSGVLTEELITDIKAGKIGAVFISLVPQASYLEFFPLAIETVNQSPGN